MAKIRNGLKKVPESNKIINIRKVEIWKSVQMILFKLDFYKVNF